MARLSLLRTTNVSLTAPASRAPTSGPLTASKQQATLIQTSRVFPVQAGDAFEPSTGPRLAACRHLAAPHKIKSYQESRVCGLGLACGTSGRERKIALYWDFLTASLAIPAPNTKPAAARPANPRLRSAPRLTSTGSGS